MIKFKFEITAGTSCNYIGFHEKYAGPRVANALKNMFNYGSTSNIGHAIESAGAFLEFTPIGDTFDFYIRLTNTNLADCADLIRTLNQHIAPLVEMLNTHLYAECKASATALKLTSEEFAAVFIENSKPLGNCRYNISEFTIKFYPTTNVEFGLAKAAIIKGGDILERRINKKNKPAPIKGMQILDFGNNPDYSENYIAKTDSYSDGPLRIHGTLTGLVLSNPKAQYDYLDYLHNHCTLSVNVMDLGMDEIKVTCSEGPQFGIQAFIVRVVAHYTAGDDLKKVFDREMLIPLSNFIGAYSVYRTVNALVLHGINNAINELE